jgi:foldase protein PrsA
MKTTVYIARLILVVLCIISMGQWPCGAQSVTKANNDLSDLFKDVILARGKGFEVNRAELDKAIITTKANRAAQGNPIPIAMDRQIESQMLDKLITTKILINKATKEQRRKGQVKAKQFLQELILQHPSEDAFQRQLLTSGMDLEFFERQILEQAIVREVIDTDLRADYIVPDAQAEAFYDTNKETFAIPQQARLQHVFIRTLNELTGQPLPPAELAKQYKLAQEVHSKAVTGTRFSDLVLTYSEDKVSRDRKGEVTIAMGSSYPEMEKTVFMMKADEISKIIKTPTGYHIMRLMEMIPKAYFPYEEVSGRIKIQLENQYVQGLLPDYLTRIKQDAQVEIMLD